MVLIFIAKWLYNLVIQPCVICLGVRVQNDTTMQI